MAVRPGEPVDAGELLASCAALADRGGAQLAPLAGILRTGGLRLTEPMRLAVVGQIKRGKSTLVNALLGAELSATGRAELTFTVSEFRYADRPEIVVHYKDGTVSTGFAPAQFHELTTRDARRAEHLRRIRKVEYGIPNPLLRHFRLVDTPGLGSVHVVDAANTRDILGIGDIADGSERHALAQALADSGRDGATVHRESIAELDQADAVLYLFSRALHQRDHTALSQFIGSAGGSLTPLKAFGVLSRCDQYWPDRTAGRGVDPLARDPLTVGDQLARQLLGWAPAARTFYTVLPVAGLLAAGANRLGDREFEWLADLVRDGGAGNVVRLLRDAERFANREDLRGVRLPVDQRRHLVTRVGAWGVALACRYLDDGLGPGQVRQRLLDHSGIPRLRALVIRHFGNRSALLKVDGVAQRARAEVVRLRLAAQRAGLRVAPEVDHVASQLERLHDALPGLAELRTLGRYYNGEFGLVDEEVDTLLRVTGEHGLDAASRVGLPPTATAGDIARAARAAAGWWAAQLQDPMRDAVAALVARQLMRSFERIEAEATVDAGRASSGPGTSASAETRPHRTHPPSDDLEAPTCART
ncbi:dynamin family protein [Micromonospora sp. NBRC 101691]|uniref:dynamin family protein n=1 Tax=Micromonospora sp. NBRC 101691 TaxID=3032198 RepID=UPI0024A5D540|nr:dynamin family protein [Micromonospora sp. NBRC 101691]GLY25531.1 isoniazid-induced protein IniC [Micromonospora sp. NBRC 101691]